MSLFKKKKEYEEDEEEENLELLRQKLQKEKEKTWEQQERLKIAEERKRLEVEAKRAERRRKHPGLVKLAQRSGQIKDWGKDVGHGVAKGAQEIVTTTLTARKLGPGGKAGLGRKYRRPKRYPRSGRRRLPQGPGPSPQQLGRGHETPNLYGFSRYGTGVTPTEGEVDLFTGPGGRDVDLVGAKRNESLLVNGHGQGLDLTGPSKQSTEFTGKDKKNLDVLGSKMNKKRKLF
jgi:hypothetical protein